MIGASLVRQMLTLVEQVADSSCDDPHPGEAGRARAGGAHDPSARAGAPAPPWRSTARRCPDLARVRAVRVRGGAFTGAAGARRTLRAANGGTLPRRSLTVAGDRNPRSCVCSRRENSSASGPRAHPVDVRILAATNRTQRHGEGQALPRGPLLSPQRHHGPRAAAAGAPRDRVLAQHHLRVCAARTTGARRLLERGARAAPNRTRGRATCASWRTSSSAWSCSREGRIDAEDLQGGGGERRRATRFSSWSALRWRTSRTTLDETFASPAVTDTQAAAAIDVRTVARKLERREDDQGVTARESPSFDPRIRLTSTAARGGGGTAGRSAGRLMPVEVRCFGGKRAATSRPTASPPCLHSVGWGGGRLG
jgi:hypothetical protein